MPGVYNIETVYQGDTWPGGSAGREFPVTLREGPEGGSMTGLDLDTATVSATVRLSRLSSSVAATFTVTPRDQSLQPGVVGLQLPASETANLDPGKYYWDLQVTWSNGDVWTPVHGYLIVTADVTA